MAPMALTEGRVGYRRTIAAQVRRCLRARTPLGNGEREPEYDARAAP